jgi:hypothetical protein
MPERFMFGVRHRDLLERHKAVLETFGYVCTVEESTVAGFGLLTLVAVRPTPASPVRYTRAEAL